MDNVKIDNDIQIVLRALDNPEVIEKLKSVIFTKQNEPVRATPKQRKDINSIKKIWGIKSKLSSNNSQKIILAIKENGLDEVMKVLEIAKLSPLRNSEGYMSKYLKDLFWCLRKDNFVKIKSGKYSQNWNSNKQEPNVKHNKRPDEDNNLMNLIK